MSSDRHHHKNMKYLMRGAKNIEAARFQDFWDTRLECTVSACDMNLTVTYTYAEDESATEEQYSFNQIVRQAGLVP